MYQESSSTTNTEILKLGGVSVYIKKGNKNWKLNEQPDGTELNTIIEDSSFATIVNVDLGATGHLYVDIFPPFTFSGSLYNGCTMAAYVIPYGLANRQYFSMPGCPKYKCTASGTRGGSECPTMVCPEGDTACITACS